MTIKIPKKFIPTKHEFTIIDLYCYQNDKPDETTYQQRNIKEELFTYSNNLFATIQVEIEPKYIIISCDFGSAGWRKYVFLFSEENLKMIKNILKR